MSKKIIRFVSVGLGVLVILAILLSALGITTVRRSFPQVDGEIQLTGLDSEVTIYRDSYGIPDIYATTLHDLFFAQGYVHAQDRFWQMDFWRHIGSGRLSEMFGKEQVETDAFLQTMGWERIAEQEVASSSAESLAILSAYTEGVNAYLADHSGAAISLEYAILGILTPDYKPEPWTPVNTMTWGKAMAWDLRGNIDAEIERALLLKVFTADQMADLYPPYPSDHPVIVEDFPVESAGFPRTPSGGFAYSELPSASLEKTAEVLALLDPLLGRTGMGIGSNSWVISGSLTASGMPLLANDPHLAIQMPSIWYQVGMHCRPRSDACPYELAGFSFAGVPGIIIGHNDRIAWGMTNNGPDVMDLYIEKINPDNPEQYEVDGQWVDFETRTETIEVGGGEPVELTIRSTRHGPVISDVYGLGNFGEEAGLDLPQDFVISLRWTALETQHLFDAIWGFNKAQNWDEFREAARSFTVPAQNLVYADVEGNIGYQMPGQVPIRKNGDGSLPVPGWNNDYEWVGYIPFEELPFLFNPESGCIVTANNQAVPRDYPYLVTTDWDYGYRAERIVEMIESAPGPIDIAYIQEMQNDSTSLNAEVLVPLLMSIPMVGREEDVRQRLLSGWDYREAADSQAAFLFESFWAQLITYTFYDEAFPEGTFPGGGSRFYEVIRNLLLEPNNFWWDWKATDDLVEDRDIALMRVFQDTVKEIEWVYGDDLEKWPTWGAEHSATFRNATLGESGIGLIESIFNRGPFPTSGGESIVNATGWSVGEGFQVDWLPSMRMIVDLGDLRGSLSVHTTGQSGHAYGKHYIDLAPLWSEGQYYPMLWNEQAVISNAESHLRLYP
jgi:penicillin G amidase